MVRRTNLAGTPCRTKFTSTICTRRFCISWESITRSSRIVTAGWTFGSPTCMGKWCTVFLPDVGQASCLPILNHGFRYQFDGEARRLSYLSKKPRRKRNGALKTFLALIILLGTVCHHVHAMTLLVEKNLAVNESEERPITAGADILAGDKF